MHGGLDLRLFQVSASVCFLVCDFVHQYLSRAQ